MQKMLSSVAGWDVGGAAEVVDVVGVVAVVGGSGTSTLTLTRQPLSPERSSATSASRLGSQALQARTS